MRISDWSSDVCSSDLASRARSPSGVRNVTSVTPRASRTSLRAIAKPADCAFASEAALGESATTSPRTTGNPRRSARSEEHTSELQSLMRISYAVFCLKKKKYKEYPLPPRKTNYRGNPPGFHDQQMTAHITQHDPAFRPQ